MVIDLLKDAMRQACRPQRRYFYATALHEPARLHRAVLHHATNGDSSGECNLCLLAFALRFAFALALALRFATIVFSFASPFAASWRSFAFALGFATGRG